MSLLGRSPYIRHARPQKQFEQMKQKGLVAQPLVMVGRHIADSFWGKGWCRHLESCDDYVDYLSNGRSYLRSGSICHLEINQGRIEAFVYGKSLYSVTITVDKLSSQKLSTIKSHFRSRICSASDLLQGKFDYDLMVLIRDRKNGIFPHPREIRIECDCPNREGMCKHLAAVLYGVGARLDSSPEMLFLLRGINLEELATLPTAQTFETGASSVGSETAEEDRVATLDVEMIEDEEVVIPELASADSSMDIKLSFPVPLTGDAIFAWRTAVGESPEAFALRFNVFPMSVIRWEKMGEEPLILLPYTLSKLHKAWEQWISDADCR